MTTVSLTDPEYRTTTPEELSAITGWSRELICRAARSGLLTAQGIIYVPSETNPKTGSYMCALKPFLNWFRGQTVAAPAQTEETATKAITLLHKLDAIRSLTEDVA